MSENVALVSEGRSMMKGPGGAWATKRLLKALNEGRPLTSVELKDLDTLRKNEWEHLDEKVVESGAIRLKAVGDLIAMGLTDSVPNALGKTVIQYENMTDMEPATVSMSGRSAKSEDDRVEFDLASLPNPIIHKDFTLDIRTLAASRDRGEGLDVTQGRVAGRLVAEAQENLLVNGGPQFGGLVIPGYTTFEHRNQINFATDGEDWAQAGKDGEEILTDTLALIEALEADRFYGPYMLYVPGGVRKKLGADFKTNSDKSILQRIKEVDGILDVKVLDQLAAANVLLVQMTDDVVKLYQGEPLQTVQWDMGGGFHVNFKAWTIAIHRLAADSEGRCGIAHMYDTTP